MKIVGVLFAVLLGVAAVLRPAPKAWPTPWPAPFRPSTTADAGGHAVAFERRVSTLRDLEARRRKLEQSMSTLQRLDVLLGPLVGDPQESLTRPQSLAELRMAMFRGMRSAPVDTVRRVVDGLAAVHEPPVFRGQRCRLATAVLDNAAAERSAWLREVAPETLLRCQSHLRHRSLELANSLQRLLETRRIDPEDAARFARVIDHGPLLLQCSSRGAPCSDAYLRSRFAEWPQRGPEILPRFLDERDLVELLRLAVAKSWIEPSSLADVYGTRMAAILQSLPESRRSRALVERSLGIDEYTDSSAALARLLSREIAAIGEQLGRERRDAIQVAPSTRLGR